MVPVSRGRLFDQCRVRTSTAFPLSRLLALVAAHGVRQLSFWTWYTKRFEIRMLVSL